MSYLEAGQAFAAGQKDFGGQGSRYAKTSKVIPPDHPAYVITNNFNAPHIKALQDLCDKHYIPMGMQTSKKKLAKMPDQPTDKFFLIVDDSLGPPILEG